VYLVARPARDETVQFFADLETMKQEAGVPNANPKLSTLSLLRKRVGFVHAGKRVKRVYYESNARREQEGAVITSTLIQ